MRTERALVLKASIDFGKLMAFEDSSRPSSPESEASIKTEPDEDLELSRYGVDGEIYLMEMTTPALQSPHASPKEVRNPYSVLDDPSVWDGVEMVLGEDSKVQTSSEALLKACSKIPFCGSVVEYKVDSATVKPTNSVVITPRILVDGVLAI
jgi:hypothetical protein